MVAQGAEFREFSSLLAHRPRNLETQAKGVRIGCKPKLTEHRRKEAIKRREKGEETMREIAQS
jgi:hypothetical protein